MAHAELVRTTIDAKGLESLVSGPENGGIVTFVGQVRNHSGGRNVAYLEYEAYEPMARAQMLTIANEAEERWGVTIAVEHRLGRIELCEAAVVVSAGSPHRAEAFEACRWVIDTVKENVPIWKREVGPDGTFWIEGDQMVPTQ